MSIPPKVVTTGHNVAGQAIFVDGPAYKPIGPGVGMIYAANDDGPVDTNEGADLDAFAAFNPFESGVIPRQGSVLLLAEFPAGRDSKKKIHRTLSVDIGVMLEGEVECHLDSGEKRLVRQGEILIQRGTKHYWVNPSPTKNARMLCFVVPSRPVDAVQD